MGGRDGDTAYNLERTLQAIASCAADTDLLVFPETQLMGFADAQQLAEVAEPLDGPSVQAVQRALHGRKVAVLVGVAERAGGAFYNTSLLITAQGVVLSYRKTHLWPSERGLFQPGDRYVTALCNGVRVGLLICYDIEFPESARALGQLGAELILVCNGNMDPYGPVHRTAIMARAQENQAFAVMVNRVGDGAEGLVFAGGSAAIDPFGRPLFEAGREECRQVVELDLDLLRSARRDYDYLRDRRLLLCGEQREYADGRRELLIA
ncbi:carbon-nitrogen hydrolase family protein [Serratia proteamaculans]|uniref:carbon-nitrogen hydrolase family protein n=1 Tax=Serratia proteamaculans TaxID=28151 RepID=UPI003CFBE152